MNRGIAFLVACGGLAAMPVASGCNRFEKPSRMECEAAFDNVIALASRDATRDKPGLDPVLRVVGRAWGFVTGEKRAAVRNCLVTMSSHEAVCVARARTMGQVRECEN